MAEKMCASIRNCDVERKQKYTQESYKTQENTSLKLARNVIC